MSDLPLAKKQKKDSRVNLLLQFGRLISEIKPDFVFAENVPGLKKGKGKKVFAKFENVLKKEGYFFTSDILDAKNYGVPQKRKRLVLLASRHSAVELPEITHSFSDKNKFVKLEELI